MLLILHCGKFVQHMVGEIRQTKLGRVWRMDNCKIIKFIVTIT